MIRDIATAIKELLDTFNDAVTKNGLSVFLLCFPCVFFRSVAFLCVSTCVFVI